MGVEGAGVGAGAGEALVVRCVPGEEGHCGVPHAWQGVVGVAAGVCSRCSPFHLLGATACAVEVLAREGAMVVDFVDFAAGFVAAVAVVAAVVVGAASAVVVGVGSAAGSPAHAAARSVASGLPVSN